VATTNKKVGIFGGSFDPPTISHQMLAMAAYAESDVDHISVMPSYNHRLKEGQTDFQDRITMCQLAFEGLGMGVSAWEKDNESGAMIDLLTALSKKHPEFTYCPIVGMDCVKEISEGKWSKSQELWDNHSFIIFQRAGELKPDSDSRLYWLLNCDWHTLLEFKPYDCSSTEIRNAIAKGDMDFAMRRVPPRVWEFIEEKGLYR